MTHYKTLTLLILITVSITSCGYAKNVNVRPNKSGVVSLPFGNYNSSREKAYALMTENCGGNKYQIVKEEEVVVGKTARTRKRHYGNRHSNHTDSSSNSSGYSTTVVTSTIDDKTEWRIYYKCTE